MIPGRAPDMIPFMLPGMTPVMIPNMISYIKAPMEKLPSIERVPYRGYHMEAPI